MYERISKFLKQNGENGDFILFCFIVLYFILFLYLVGSTLPVASDLLDTLLQSRAFLLEKF